MDCEASVSGVTQYLIWNSLNKSDIISKETVNGVFVM